MKLTNEERDFFTIVGKAAFSNPFGNERCEADELLAGTVKRERGIPALDAALEQLRQRLSELHSKNRGNFRQYSGNDEILLKNSLLFDIYHQYMEYFDKLIEHQCAQPEDSCRVDFAESLLQKMNSVGFNKTEALKYLSFFFQMRRAFYFLTRDLAGKSNSMQKLRHDLWSTIFTSDVALFELCLWDRMEDFSTLLCGETGSGKGAAAAAIGRSGFIPFDPKSKKFAESFTSNFISINLSQFSESVLESELFGHKKGAFTGAIENHKGVFGLCTPHGSILLDEVGEVNIPVQIKLLRVLQERSYTPVGDHKVQRFSGRILAATNRNIDELRQSGDFRDDFYYRLCTNVIEMPSLRTRLNENPEEIQLLTTHILNRIVGKVSPGLLSTVIERLSKGVGENYSWPGNVRELEQAIRRILLVGHYTGEALRKHNSPTDRLMDGITSGSLTAEEIQSLYCSLLYQQYGTYEAVARKTELDRRTVKRYIEMNIKTS